MSDLIEIEIVDAVACRIETRHAKKIEPPISFVRTYWTQTPQGKRQKVYSFAFWLKKGKRYHYFLTGYLPSIMAFCRENNLRIKITGNRPGPSVPVSATPKLSGITFRPDQWDAIKTAVTRKRGIIKAPTRTGKTVIQFGICSCFPMNVLFLADKVDLVQQLAEEGRRFGFNVHEIHGQCRDLAWDKNGPNVVCMTRKTAKLFFTKKENKWACDFFDALIVDECHHVTTAEGEYSDVLTAVCAPLRFGFTATLPESSEEAMSCLTGFLGPLIYDLTINEAIKNDLLVKPKIILIKPPLKKIAVNTKYDEVYQQGIVDHMSRHDLVAKKAIEYISAGKSVLILVNRLDHGIYQQYAFEKLMPNVEVPFLHGESESWEREKAKEGLKTKKVLCVIVSTIWKEGINIPSLDVCINAAGGVSEIATLQGVGRSLTKSEGKDCAIIVDVFDQAHHYLIRHFGERSCLYMDNGWL